MQRREFLQQVALVAVSAASACRRARTREEVLAGLVRDIVVHDTEALATASRKFEQSLTEFVAAPTTATLGLTRTAFRAALVAWKRAQCFRNGPIVESDALLRASFWPARPSAIENLLRESTPLDERGVRRLGVDVKGLYALEYLLFPLEQDDATTTETFRGEAGARRRQLSLELSRSVNAYANHARGLLGDGAAFAERFALGGQKSLSNLVAQLIVNVETVAANRLELVAGLARSRLLKPGEVEGWPSGSSQALVATQLEASEKFFLGGSSGGVTELVRAVAPEIDQSVRAAFARARQRVDALQQPLERVVLSDPAAIDQAAAAAKRLELALKVDTTNALGITLTFQSGDGD